MGTPCEVPVPKNVIFKTLLLLALVFQKYQIQVHFFSIHRKKQSFREEKWL
jgi:hypothetical protein